MIRRIIGFVADILARGRAAPPRSYPIISRPAGFLPAAAAPDCGDTAEFFQEAMVADVIPSIEAGVDSNAQDEYDQTLDTAAFNEDPAVIESLLAAGADPNAQDEYGRTPLHRAA